jgi:hypothetical protein
MADRLDGIISSDQVTEISDEMITLAALHGGRAAQQELFRRLTAQQDEGRSADATQE